MEKPGFTYWTSTPPNQWDSLRYHKAWEAAGLPMDKGTITLAFRNQLQWFESNGSEEEKKVAAKLSEKFQWQS
ncbi:hypothetical protein BC936DRAFT_138619 [Jimgerdemannia flammicorona]|nr:hypothetical protein BC936DRAFT_138619 [Jimgerdemannia flammicorona]